jgi:acyl-CoA thioester hydrolase
VGSSCDYRAAAAFPEPLEVGIGVERLGTTSITWALGILRGGEEEPIAVGRFVHVFVDAVTRRPVPVPPAVRAAVQAQLRG